MDITMSTPALLFPAISLILLAYTNRFLGLAGVARQLHDRFLMNKVDTNLHTQIKNLRSRILLVRRMQFMGVISILLCIISMFFIYIDEMNIAQYFFGASLISFTISLIISLIEITQSTKALELELSDMENIKDPTLVEFIKQKFDDHDE